MKKPKLDFKVPKLDLKLPSFGGKRPALPKTNVKAPQFLTDLYVDLRDRRLLPLVALLVVGILAAPFLFGGSDEDEPPPLSTPAPQGSEATAASFSVVPSEPGLRDYRKRLGHRQARNPFAQPATQASDGAGGAADPGGESAGDEGGAVVVGGGSEGSSGGSPSAGPTTTTTTTTTNVVVESKVTGFALKARAGFLGELKEQDRITSMTTLPSAKNPVLVFVGPSKDEKGAIFLMTSNVTAFYGKARCVLDEQTCSTVELRPGHSATFAYGFGETRYKLTLQKIYPLVETSEEAASVTEKSDGMADEEKED